MIQDSSQLSKTAMLVHLHIKRWCASKKDQQVTDKAHQDFQASAGAGHFQKNLLHKDAMRKVRDAANAARKHNRENTLPWDDSGYRILPAKNHPVYSTAIAKIKADFDKAADEFCAEFAVHVEAQRALLGQMFKEGDYPAPAEVRGQFELRVDLMPLPAQKDFRVDISQVAADRIKLHIETKTQQAVSDAVRELWNRLYKNLTHVVDRLGDGDKIFRNSLIENMAALVDTLPRLNMKGDKELDKVAAEIKKTILKYSPEELRESDGKRAEIASQSQNMLERVKAALEGAK